MAVLNINSRAACFSHFHSRHCEINFFERRRRARIDAENGHRRVTRPRLRIIATETLGYPTGYLRAQFPAQLSTVSSTTNANKRPRNGTEERKQVPVTRRGLPSLYCKNTPGFLRTCFPAPPAWYLVVRTGYPSIATDRVEVLLRRNAVTNFT